MADINQFAFSFSHATITVNGTVYTAIDNVEFDQSVERSAIYGTAQSPIKRSAGQLGLGEGTIVFADLEEGMQFHASLGEDAINTVFDVEVSFSNPAGQIRTFELLSCCIAGVGGSFAQGADAMQKEVPFDYMRTKVDGVLISAT